MGKTVKQSKDEDSWNADLGLPVSGTGLDLCRLFHGHGGLEDLLYRRARWELRHNSGLVLVQSVEGLLHGLRFHIQLLRLPRAVVCRRLSSDREGSAHVWDGCWSAGLHPESRGNGMHLHRRKRQREEPIGVHRRHLSHNKWYAGCLWLCTLCSACFCRIFQPQI